MNYNQEHYDEFWKDVSYFKTTSPGNRWIFDLLKEILQSVEQNRIQSVLDVGSGEGSKTYFLSSEFKDAQVLGIDFTKSGVEIASSHYANQKNLKFQCVDANNAAVWEETYDLIFCSEVLEHIEDWKTVVGQFAQAAKHYILLTFPTGRMRKYEVGEGHLRNFKKGEMEEFLEEHQFNAIKIFNAGFPFYSPIGRELANIKWIFHVYDEKIRKSNKPTRLTRLYSNVFYFLFTYCSTKYRLGDQFIGLFEKRSQ